MTAPTGLCASVRSGSFAFLVSALSDDDFSVSDSVA